MSFYAIFDKLCEVKRISHARVRADLGISQSTMASWKSRNLTPKPATVQRLANYFGVSVDFLLGVETECTIKPNLNVGDTYFNGAMRVTQANWESSPASFVLEIDENKMSADDLVALLGAMEKISGQSGVSIEGLALLAEAASKAINSTAEPQQPEQAPAATQTAPAPQDSKDTILDGESSEGV